MFKNMKLSAKIGVGFGLLIMIACILGGIAIFNMKKVAAESTILANEYIPEVEIGAELRGAVNRAMYEMRGYAYSENKLNYDNAKMEIAAIQTALDHARNLDETASNLKKLKVEIETTSGEVKNYEDLVAQTNKIIVMMGENRNTLDTSAQKYMSECATFLDGQNKAIARDLGERLAKIQLVNEIVAIGTKTRVLNFKSQALKDTDMMEKAISQLQGIDGQVAKLRPLTKSAVNIKQIDDTVSSANAYGGAMERFLLEFRKGENADKGVLSKQHEKMDATASIYVKNCDDFMTSQYIALEKDMSERLQKITLVNDIINNGNAARIATFKSQALRNPKLITDGVKIFDRIKTKCDDLRKITRLEKDIKLIDETEENGTRYKNAMLSFFGNWEILQDLGKQRDVTGNKMVDASKIMAEAAISETKDISQNAVASLNSSTTVMVIGLITALVIGIALAFAITRSIVGPLTRIIFGLTEGSEQVSSAAGQVSSASQSLAEGATEQAAGLEETSSSLEEMASMTRQNADNAQQANTLAADARKAAKTGNEKMTKMNTAIRDIQTSSDKTAKIIKVIDEIAFQTNLLALNAAVEAARAGEAGKGFAVVAEEVRNLAMRSAEAAKDTSAMIEESVKNANNGVEIASEVGKVLGEIVEGISKTTDLVGEIAAASQEQSQGIDQVNTAVSQMDKVTQANAANAEESASASEELSAQAEQMNSIVEELSSLVGGGSVAMASSRSKTKRTFSASDHTFHQIAGGGSSAQSSQNAVEQSTPLGKATDLDGFNS